MTAYRVRQFGYAFVLSACGIAVAIGLIARAIDEAVSLPHNPH